MIRFCALASLALLLGSTSAQTLAPAENIAAAREAKVYVYELPGRVHQPDLVIDAQGTIHVVYFKPSRRQGRPYQWRGDLWYATRTKDSSSWSEPIRVNAKPNQVALAAYSQIELGVDGRVHIAWVCWNPKGFWYTRTKSKGEGFETERDLMRSSTRGIETGPALASDGKGRVYYMWHEGAFKDEDKRVVYMRTSKNDGKKFAKARKISPRNSGACGCCGMAATVGAQGQLFVAFRGKKKKNRDMLLLESTDGGKSFKSQTLQELEFEQCPRGLTTLATSPGGKAVVAWENALVTSYFANIDKFKDKTRVPQQSKLRQRFPAIAVNNAGEVLFSWNEGDGQGGGIQHWQLFDKTGRPAGQKGKSRGGLPPMSYAAAGAFPDGDFVLVY